MKRVIFDFRKANKIKILFIILICIQNVSIAQQVFSISPKSNFIIEGTSTFHDWSVKASGVEGTIKLVQSTPANSLPLNFYQSIADIQLQINVNEIKSEKGKTMDNKMYKALKKNVHSKIFFDFIEQVSFNRQEDEYIIKGKVSIAGVEKKIEIKFMKDFKDNILYVTGKRELKLTDFNIEPPKAMFGQIQTGNDIIVIFNLIFSKS